MLNDARPAASDALGQMSQADFIEAWRTIVGELPALILPSRSEMIEILIQSRLVVSECMDGPSPCASQERTGRNQK